MIDKGTIYFSLLLIFCLLSFCNAKCIAENDDFYKLYNSRKYDELRGLISRTLDNPKISTKKKAITNFYDIRLKVIDGVNLDTLNNLSINNLEWSIKHNSGANAICKNAYNTAEIHYRRYQADSAILFLNVAKQYIDGVQEHWFKKKYYNLLFAIYYQKGEMHSALNYINKAIDNAEKEGNTPESMISLWHNKSALLLTLKENKELNKVQKILLDNAIHLPDYKTHGYSKHWLYKNIAWNIAHQGNIDSAIYLLKKSKDYIKAEKQEDYINMLSTYNSLASYYEKLGEHQLFEKSCQQMLSIIGRSDNKKFLKYYHDAIMGIARSNLQKNNPNGTIIQLDSLEDILFRRFMIDENEFHILSDIYSLRAKAKQNKYLRSKSVTDLLECKSDILIAVQYAIRKKKQLYTSKDKLNYLSRYYDLFELALSIMHEIHQIAPDNEENMLSALMVMDQIHSAVLEDHTDLRFDKPEIIRNKEDSLLKARAYYLYDTLQEGYSRQVQDINIQLHQLNANFNVVAWEHIALKEFKKDIQKKLNQNEAAYLTFFTGKDHIYAQFITEDKHVFFKVDGNSQVFDNINQLSKVLYTKEQKHGFKGDSISYKIYQSLLNPLEKDIEDIENLVISPSGKLYYIPFDILVSKFTEDNNPLYLAQTHNIQYAFSLKSFMNKKANSKKKYTHNILAMAPFVDQWSRSLPSQSKLDYSIESLKLPFSRREVSSISSAPLLAENATKSYFMDYADSSKIIHLATHAKVNPETPTNSYILFYPNKGLSSNNKLYTEEIKAMNLSNVKMATLTACQTGNGKLLMGEGVMSLARSFAYAGVPCLLMTLWNADDESTSYIVSNFYDYLKQGYSKSESLFLAKKDFRENDDFRLINKNPFYWANIQLLGDSEPLFERKRSFNSRSFVICIFTTILLVLFIYVFSKYRKVILRK
ncbi:CHAT domain-containing protein [Aureibacter tunicatorum]|uniref:CHAT domain-containing protein n=1 Tax=Aureibacter tunicatorum TaxID=866807 RepID=A0AAE3XQB1_9BACT|nr:CHAT domain-containing protein [Aureibacter tunicatorum]MDR6242076.1 CHAT domain-containing protein [Aureibacter tunicatorum]BDD07554.1 hypothetical protein AUTU_50370 [Aureibacter tunicatorum]